MLPHIASPPPLKPRNDVDLTREKLIYILEFFSQVLAGAFNNRPMRLVIHGGACMLLHPMLYNLSSQQHQLHPTLPHRTSTRDVDYIHRSFIIEMSQLGIPDAAIKLKTCIERTAVQFQLGADWMNSDADIALPMATGPNGVTYDPIYHASVQPNNIDLHTIYRSTNNMLTLISVTPFWAVSLKLVRYVPQDAADICLLLRNGTILSNTTWTFETLREWLFANCWVMGYSSYDRARLQQFNIRLQHAIQMVNDMGNSSSTTPPGTGANNSPSFYVPSADPNNIENLMKGDKEREMSARHSNPQQTTPPQFPQTASFPQPQPHHLGLQESNWASVNLNFTPAAQLGRITPEAAMGGGGYVVGGVHGQGWTPWGPPMPVPNPVPAQEGPSSRNSPTYPEARDSFDFTGPDFNVAVAKKEKKKKKRKEGLLSDDEAISMPTAGGRGSIGGASTLGREPTWPSFGSSMAPGPPPGVAGTFASIEGMGELQRSLEEIMPALSRSPPHTRVASPVPPAISPQPYAFHYGSPPMPVPVIPIVNGLNGLDDEASIRAARRREKEERKQEKRRQEKKKDKERRIERQISAGQRGMEESLLVHQVPSAMPLSAEVEEYYRRATGASPTPGSRSRNRFEETAVDSGNESDELQTPPPERLHPATEYAPPDSFGGPPLGYGYTSPQRTPPLGVPGYFSPASTTPPGRSTIPPIPTLPAEPLVPIPPVASPIPDEKRRKSRSNESGKRRKSKRASDDSEEEAKEHFIPPGFQGDEYPQQQDVDRNRPTYQYQQLQQSQHNIYQQHAQQSAHSYSQQVYPHQQQQHRQQQQQPQPQSHYRGPSSHQQHMSRPNYQ